MKIVAHCLVRNEEYYIWYALKSVLPFVEKIMVWDTGSSDATVDLVKSIDSPKIDFKEVGVVGAGKHTAMRQKMLNETDKKEYDWLMILDGDEIWPSQSFSSVFAAMKNPQANTIVVHTRNLVGDIYHYLPESAGGYKIAGHKGHLGLRFIRLSTPNLQIQNPHGGQTFTTNGTPLQDQKEGKVIILDAHYYHTTNLPRSPHDITTLKRYQKRKYELGLPIQKYELPHLLFANRPGIVPDVTMPMSFTVYLKCLLFTLPRRLKRLLIKPKSGYLI